MKPQRLPQSFNKINKTKPIIYSHFLFLGLGNSSSKSKRLQSITWSSVSEASLFTPSHQYHIHGLHKRATHTLNHKMQLLFFGEARSFKGEQGRLFNGEWSTSDFSA
jgi:hypothetical protein